MSELRLHSKSDDELRESFCLDEAPCWTDFDESNESYDSFGRRDGVSW